MHLPQATPYHGVPSQNPSLLPTDYSAKTQTPWLGHRAYLGRHLSSTQDLPIISHNCTPLCNKVWYFASSQIYHNFLSWCSFLCHSCHLKHFSFPPPYIEFLPHQSRSSSITNWWVHTKKGLLSLLSLWVLGTSIEVFNHSLPLISGLSYALVYSPLKQGHLYL
jgi:hypothetical protein